MASPARILVSVVLPAPFRPTRPTLSPAATRKLTFSRRRRAPARTSRLWVVIMRVRSVDVGTVHPDIGERPGRAHAVQPQGQAEHPTDGRLGSVRRARW